MQKSRVISYGKVLGEISDTQLQDALNEFNLGTLTSTEAIPFGLFGQNIILESTSGSYVLRTHAHYNWQLPTEQFFCRLIHERTKIPAPWPYLCSEKETIFGFIFGFAIMPRLPGFASADPEVYRSLDKTKLATALAKTLLSLQSLKWNVSGTYDQSSYTVKPFPKGYIARTVSRIKDKLAASLKYPESQISLNDRDWLESEIQDISGTSDNFQPVIVHEDFNRNNVCVEYESNSLKVSGIFDWMTAHFGDPLADLPRQFCMFFEESSQVAAETYLRTYFSSASLDDTTRKRLRLYLIDERMLNWDYFHQPGRNRSGFENKSLRKWLEAYLNALDVAFGKIT